MTIYIYIYILEATRALSRALTSFLQPSLMCLETGPRIPYAREEQSKGALGTKESIPEQFGYDLEIFITSDEDGLSGYM